MAPILITKLTFKFNDTSAMGKFIHQIPNGWSTKSTFETRVVEVFKPGYPMLKQIEIDQINTIKNSIV